MLHFSCSDKKTHLQDDELFDAIDRSADFLVNALKENGQFVYRINMDSSVKLKNKYNILRHSGTIYAMSMYQEIRPDEKVKEAITTAGRYLQNEAISPVPGQKNMLAIWSKPEINGSGQPLQAKLGGTGIGLVALLSIEKISPGFTSLSDLRALGKFIVYMQKPNGSFYSKYIPSLGGPQDNWNSLYYPGEAALGLLLLYEKDPSDIWLKSATAALEFLAISRKNSSSIPSDHWALLATEKLFLLKHNKIQPESRILLTNHAIQICESILKDQIHDSQNPMLQGGFTSDGRTTPTATRLEGLLAAANFLPPTLAITNQINSAIPKGIAFLREAQIKEGEFTGAMPRSVCKLNANNTAAKKYNRRVKEVRIDYVQHAMSAMIQYMNLLK